MHAIMVNEMMLLCVRRRCPGMVSSEHDRGHLHREGQGNCQQLCPTYCHQYSRYHVHMCRKQEHSCYCQCLRTRYCHVLCNAALHVRMYAWLLLLSPSMSYEGDADFFGSPNSLYQYGAVKNGTHVYMYVLLYILGECLTLLASGSDPFDYRSEQFNVSTHHYDTACE